MHGTIVPEVCGVCCVAGRLCDIQKSDRQAVGKALVCVCLVVVTATWLCMYGGAEAGIAISG